MIIKVPAAMTPSARPRGPLAADGDGDADMAASRFARRRERNEARPQQIVLLQTILLGTTLPVGWPH
ncbi:hypothetical protein AN219_25710, partial [Streptomyces nanshensis]